MVDPTLTRARGLIIERIEELRDEIDALTDEQDDDRADLVEELEALTALADEMEVDA